jgi:arylsulfatase A-like enzyme
VAARSEDIGYSEVLAGKQEGAEVCAATFLRHHQNLNRPFFLDVGFFETHRLTAGGAFNHAGPEGDPRYCLPFPTMPDAPEVRQDVADFKVAATRLDDKMGTVLDALAASGLAGDTLVICTTDHGPAFPGMKCNLQDHGIGIMLILRGPGGFLGGRVSDALVSQIDLFPTLCDLVGIARPKWLQGQSLLPLVQDTADEINDAIYAGVTYHAAYEPQRAVRTRRWKYIRRFSGKPGPILPNCDDSPSKTLWLSHGWREHRLPDEALYDLAFDPMERDNLAPEATCQPVLQNMRDRLDTWMRSTDDPLLHGPVPAPPGAVMNDPDGLSPDEPVITAR